MHTQKIDRIEEALQHLIKQETECRLCPRECRVNRSRGEKGFCQPELICNDSDIAQKGLIIRHLILPAQSEDSLHLLEWMARTLSSRVCLSLMSQYWPCFKAPSSLQRTLGPVEYNQVLDRAFELGFETLFFQPDPFAPDEHRLPDFNGENPFEWT